MFLIALGALTVVVGVLLPWGEASISMSGAVIPDQTATGLDYAEGEINLIVAIASGVLGLLAAGRNVQPRLLGSLIVIASAAVIVMTGLRIADPGDEAFSSGPFTLAVDATLLPGIFITAAGGVVLLIGGLALLLRSPG